ncbi:hypothetical protein [Celeribacter sp.]|uniref:hypothetical protein n=1 Tax=Celeribacter sp. TaxID=1890673 RepID=UPI003A945C7E
MAKLVNLKKRVESTIKRVEELNENDRKGEAAWYALEFLKDLRVKIEWLAEAQEAKPMTDAERTALRDKFAGQALSAYLTSPLLAPLPKSDDYVLEIAGHCYVYADAMLKAREI